MRNRKTISLGSGRVAFVNELRVRDARKLMAQAKDLEQIEIKEILGERFNDIAGLLGDCVVLPDGETLDDLSFSEVSEIKDGLIEVNAAFLDLLGLAGLVQKTPSATSTAPAADLSNEDTGE